MNAVNLYTFVINEFSLYELLQSSCKIFMLENVMLPCKIPLNSFLTADKYMHILYINFFKTARGLGFMNETTTRSESLQRIKTENSM